MSALTQETLEQLLRFVKNKRLDKKHRIESARLILIHDQGEDSEKTSETLNQLLEAIK